MLVKILLNTKGIISENPLKVDSIIIISIYEWKSQNYERLKIHPKGSRWVWTWAVRAEVLSPINSAVLTLAWEHAAPPGSTLTMFSISDNGTTTPSPQTTASLADSTSQISLNLFISLNFCYSEPWVAFHCPCDIIPIPTGTDCSSRGRKEGRTEGRKVLNFIKCFLPIFHDYFLACFFMLWIWTH